MIHASSNITDFMPGMYVVCIYKDEWLVGNIIEISEQYNEIHFKFMKKNRKCFSCPTKDNQCWIPLFMTAWDMLSLYWFKEIMHVPI